MIRIGSLFTGIGLFDLGILWALTEAGIDCEVAYQVEIDPFCRGVLSRHFPNATRFNDVAKVGSADLVRVDVLCGGFPCTGISVAGRGAGLDDEQSGLWRDFARIVGETSPRAVCIENSSALVTRGLDVVVGDLERAGYDVEAAIVRASDVGAPHRRERIFILSVRRDATGAGSSALADRDGFGREGIAPIYGAPTRLGVQSWDDSTGRGNGHRRRDAQPGMGRDIVRRAPWLVRWPARPGQPQSVWEPPRSVTAYSPTRNARLHALGNAIVPHLVALRFGPRLVEIFGNEA